MKIIKPSYEIIQCPDSEQCLALLERIGRIAYKSEAMIDDGFRPCPECHDKTYITPIPDDPEFKRACNTCVGAGKTKQTEPSSYGFIRMILRSDRRNRLTKQAVKVMEEPLSPEEKATKIVNMSLDDVRDNPPHLGILEHVVITVLFISNRGFTHELVRHRLASYVQESTRYCNYSKGKFGNEITLIERSAEEICEELDTWIATINEIEQAYLKMTVSGVKPEIARDLLPQVLKAEIACTANLSEWRHIFRLRCSPRAHPDMRRLMLPLLTELRQRIPIVFDEL
jgi:thymidylate synthase (FAD)